MHANVDKAIARTTVCTLFFCYQRLLI